MTAGLSGTFNLAVNGAGMTGNISWTEDYNESLNQSTVTARFRVSKDAGYSTTYGTFSGYITIAGTQQNFSGTVSIAAGETNTIVFTKTSDPITHNADGSLSVTITADGAVSGTSWTDSYGTATVAMTNFVRLPTAPATGPTLSRNAAGTTVTILSGTATSPVAISSYQYRQSTDGTTWGTATTMATPSSTTNITGLTATQIYYYQTRAVSSEGNGPWSATKYTAGAPATITATRTGRNVAVVAGNANGTVSAYYVQYSINAGVDWTTPVAMTAQAYTYSSLTAALTYVFRVYAVGDGTNTSYTTSAGVFVPAGGKRWNTAVTPNQWSSTSTGRRWNTAVSPNAWTDLTVAKRWNGSTWVDLS